MNFIELEERKGSEIAVRADQILAIRIYPFNDVYVVKVFTSAFSDGVMSDEFETFEEAQEYTLRIQRDIREALS